MSDKKNIIILIGKAIKEGKYLDILYKNKNGEITPFWISILDINANDEPPLALVCNECLLD